jgi:phosphinothricin acetyltransferase
MKQPSTTVRPAEPADAVAVNAIYSPIVRDTAISFEVDAPSKQVMAGRIESTLVRYPWLVAERQGDLIGYAYAGEHRQRAAYRWSVDVTAYVAETARGSGVGRGLYTLLVEILRAQGFRAAFAGITLPNAASVALHESVGFEPLAIYREVGFKLGTWRDVGWWRLSLSASEGPPAEPVAFAAYRQTPEFNFLIG